MTTLGFFLRTGRLPRRDDLDRVNCRNAGLLYHRHCGWCPTHYKPNFQCGCMAVPKRRPIW